MAPAEPTSSQANTPANAPSNTTAEVPSKGPSPRRSSPARPRPLLARLRQAHATLAPFVLAPLLLTVCSGLAYRLLRDWGGLERNQAHLLMVLHEGEWLGPYGETIYVLLNGLGLLWMLASGGAMAWQRLQRQWGGADRS